jgi:hypothetical protein
MKTPLLTFVAFAAVVSLTGCTTTPVVEAPRPPAPESPGQFSVRLDTAVQTDLGAVALARSPIRAELQLERLPLSHLEAGHAGASRVLDEFKKGGGGDLGGAIILLPAAIGLGAAGGWIHGAVSGMNGAELNRATDALAKAGAGFALVERLTGAILAHAADYPARSVALHPWQLPAEPSVARQRLRAAATGGATSPLPPHPLAAQNIDTVAMLEIRHHALCGTERNDSPLALELEARVRLQRTRDWSGAGEFVVHYASAPRSLAEWAHDDARLLRREWETATAGLEQRITDALARRTTPRLSHP